jgi:hypothetical protein
VSIKTLGKISPAASVAYLNPYQVSATGTVLALSTGGACRRRRFRKRKNYKRKEITMKNIVCFIKGRAIIDYTARTHSLWNRARVLGASAALLLVITLASNALAQWCPEPPAGQAFEDFYHPFVRVYTGTNFTGICHMLGRTLTIANLGAPRDQFHQSLTLATNFNNQIRSIQVGRSVRLRLFDGTNFSGAWKWWETSSPDLRGWNGRASSLRVEDRAIKPDCSNLPSNTVAIYEDSDFHGDCRVLSPGCYDGAEEMGFENDSISSVRNNAGSVYLYPQAHYRFESSCFLGLPCIKDEGLEGVLIEGEDFSYVGDDINDTTTSICIHAHSPQRARAPVLPQ